MKILYVSSVAFGWHKQRPQFVCEELSKRHNVCYTSFTPLGKNKFKGSVHSERLKVKDLYVLPLSMKSRLVRFLNKSLINLILNIKAYDCVIVTHPLFLEYLPDKCRIIYECMDNMTAFYTGSKKMFIKHCESELCKNSEKIIVSSNKLKEKIVSDYLIDETKVTVINNAVNKSLTKVELETINLKRPNLVYVGTVDSWFDFGTLDFFCNTHPECNVYVVGKLKCDKKDFPSNMIFVGKVEHNRVLSYVKSSDIVIMPFKVNELIEYVDPVKMYEYKAFNKTIISSYWQELERFENVYFYKDKEDFVNIYETVTPNETKISQQFIEKNCWEERVVLYEKVLTNEKMNKFS